MITIWVSAMIAACVISFLLGGLVTHRLIFQQARYEQLLGNFVAQQINNAPLSDADMMAIILGASESARDGREPWTFDNADFHSCLHRVNSSEIYAEMYKR